MKAFKKKVLGYMKVMAKVLNVWKSYTQDCKLEATTILLSRSASFKPIEGSALIEGAGCTYRRR